MRISWAGLALAVGLASGWAEQPVSRISFGSCYKPEKKTALWKAVSDFDPQVWLWLGDNVYADVIDGKYIKKDLPKDAFDRAYRLLGESEGIAALKTLPPGHMMATWDDHDYGRNDAGKNWERKKDAKKDFVKFWGGEEREDGVYSARDFGPEGRRIRVVLLDTRFNRDDPGAEGDILGEKQWEWLAEQLAKPGAELIVIGSSIQVLADQHRFEKWGNFPKAKERLFRLIRETHAHVVLVSGDRHHAEISKQPASPAGYPLFEVTSSGLTEKSSIRNEVNDLRIGEVYVGENFGVIQVDWSQADPGVRLEIRGEEGQVEREAAFPLSQLAPPKG
jgi:alkaline phosphatase D